MPFRCDARNFFLTFPQSTDLPHQVLHQRLLAHSKLPNVYSSREAHQDGHFHHHAILQFPQKFNCRNEREFDIEYNGTIFHPSIEGCRSVSASNDYVGKDGNTLGEPIATIAAQRRSTYEGLLADSNNARQFMELAEERDAKNFVLNHSRLEEFAAKRWGRWEQPVDPEFPTASFNNVPDSLTQWVNTELNRTDGRRPKCLILVGGPELGKSCWAQSLGIHHYWTNRFTGSRVRDAKYAILDDFDTYDDHHHEFKGIWGGQKRIGVKVSNGVSGHKQWDWGIPSIWLFNRLPSKLWDEQCYARQRSVLVEINTPLF